MIYVECDRCGKREKIENISSAPNTKKLVVWKDVGITAVNNMANDMSYDLCANCMNLVSQKIKDFVSAGSDAGRSAIEDV